MCVYEFIEPYKYFIILFSHENVFFFIIIILHRAIHDLSLARVHCGHMEIMRGGQREAALKSC